MEARHEQDRRARPAERPARSCRRGCTRRRADRGAAPASFDLDRPGHARVGPRDRRGGAPAAARAGCQGDQRSVRDHPRRPAGHRPKGRDRCRKEAAMTLWWIGDFVLLLVVAPVVVLLLNGVLSEARAIVPTVRGIAETGRAGSKDLDAAPLLLTT